MGQLLVDWVDSQPRKTRDYPRGLTKTERAVYRAMCRVTAEDRCLFYMHLDDLLERLPDIPSSSALRNHVYSLHAKGYIDHVSLNDRRAQRGGGHSSHFVYHPDGTRLGRRSVTHWLIVAAGITPEYPRQGRMPLLALYRTTPKPAVQEDWILAHPDLAEPENLARPLGRPGRQAQGSQSDLGRARKSGKISHEPAAEEPENLAQVGDAPENLAEVAPGGAGSARKSGTNASNIQTQSVPENLARARGEVPENLALPHVLGGYEKRISNRMHASMLASWTESFLGRCASRSGIEGLRQLHLQLRPTRQGSPPAASVYDSVLDYIQREGRAPPEEIAGWLADELHYSLKYDPSWQDGGHESETRLVAFIASVVQSNLAREGGPRLRFNPGKADPETSGRHRYQPNESQSRMQPIRRSL